MKKLRMAPVVGVSAIVVGCIGSESNTENAGERTAERTQALGFVAKSATSHRVIRAKNRGCTTIDGTGGLWRGAPLRAPIGTTDAFCTYAWLPSTAGALPDTAVLEAKAVRDRRWGPYAVKDAGPGTSPVGEVALKSVDIFTSAVPSVPPRPTASPSTLTIGGARTTSQRMGDFDLAIKRPTQPTGLSGCDVCVELDITKQYLWFVLPPEALAASSITLETSGGNYEIGPTTASIFYTTAPAQSSTSFSVHFHW